MKYNKNYKSMLTVLMITVGLDFMGFLVTFPLFPALFFSKTSLLVSSATSPVVRNIYYSIALAAWPVGCFFGTAYLGALSDKTGRKKIMVFCLSIVAFTYLLQAFAINMHLLYVFFLSRLLQGFFGGNYDVAQAAVADISPPEAKARNMGLIAFAGSIGIIFGPLVSALTTSSNIISWFSVTTPFWVAAILGLINVFWVVIVLKETYKPKIKEIIKISKIFTSFLFMFLDKRVMRLSVILFFLEAGWGFYVEQIPIILQKRFHYDSHIIGLFFLIVGIGFALAMQYIQPILIKKFVLKNVYIYSMFILIILLLIAGFMPTIKIEWAVAFFVAIFYVTAYGCMLAILSNAVTHDEQGKVMGGSGAIGCLAFALTSLLLSYLSTINILLPVILAGVSYLTSGLILIGKTQKEKTKRL